jgi:hypothetical protein
MFTATATQLNSHPAVASRARRCPNTAGAWLANVEMPVFADTYVTGIKHPAWRPPEEPM